MAPSSPSTQRILVGSLASGLPTDDATIVLDLGPDHPSRAGLLELNVTATDGVITTAKIQPGAMHRGAEKLFEVRDYRQILMLADRHDWQAPFFGELAAAETFERLLRLQPPPRAVWLRTLMAEHTRILSHLGYLGWTARDEIVFAGRIREAREALRGQTAALTGNRIHPMVTRIGGFAADPDEAWLHAEADLMLALEQLSDDLVALPLPGQGVGVVTTELVDAFGLSGPVARAAGVRLDSRLSAPTGAYAELGDLLRHPRGHEGDAQSRFAVLIEEIATSARLVRACCERVPQGPVQVRLPKIVKLPEAELYGYVEAPLGRTGFHVVSRGGKTPWRMKLRSPSFHHIAALESLLPGEAEDHIELILASVGYVIGDLDK